MTNINDKFNKVIDNMYNVRSSIRQLYLNNNISGLESELSNTIQNTLKSKCTSTYISVGTFSISIDIEENTSNRTLQTVENRIDSVLRNFIKSSTSENNVLEYVNNINNPIFDSYTVGNSLKFLL